MVTIEELLNQYNQLNQENKDLKDRLANREREIEKLQNHIRNANKKVYGAKTEKLTSNQIKFDFNQSETKQLELISEEIVVQKHSRKVQRGRKPLPADLPREQVIYEPEQKSCSCCGKDLVVIGEDRSEELEKIPAQLKVIEHIRVKKACPNCKGAGVLVPPLPASVLPIEKARPGAGLLADIIVSKYVDHQPLHRQEQIFARQGIALSRKRMCDWVAKVVDLLEPLYNSLYTEILGFNYIQGDETTLKVQDGEIQGKCSTGYLWGLLGPPNLVWFHYASSRAGEVPKQILKDFSGILQTDAYAGYNTVLLPNKCIRIACLAHVRRKFIEVQKTAQQESGQVLQLIAKLYHLENEAKDESARLILRQKKSLPILEKLFEFLKTTNEIILPRSPLAGAISYTLKQEIEIRRIFDSGMLALDNNAIERQMRPIAIGRKNYLFAGSHEGAYRAAVLYSLLNTCKLNKVNPWQWLSDVLRRISSDRHIDASGLLPHRWTCQS